MVIFNNNLHEKINLFGILIVIQKEKKKKLINLKYDIFAHI